MGCASSKHGAEPSASQLPGAAVATHAQAQGIGVQKAKPAAEVETLRRENERLRNENATLRAEIDTLRASSATAEAAWEPFLPLLRSAADSDLDSGDKLVMPAEFFLFGQTQAFMDGLPGMLEGGLLRSMAEEARTNEGGRWWEEFRYVVERAAEEDVPDLPSTAKFKGKRSVSGDVIVRDRGHAGMTLRSFCEHAMAKGAQLTVAEVAAIRCYSGPMFAPINNALRTQNIADWATTIGCCYSGVLKLSFLSQPARVYRGVNETGMRLPDDFLSREEGKFAGGVERAFMSTTKSPAVALDYSGGEATVGSLFVIDFDMNSRGASIQWLSQYPHEEELLFPPCTGLSCKDVSQHGRKRCVLVNAQVSTARLDTREVTTPGHVPGTEAAMRWVAGTLFGCTVEELGAKEEWNLEKKSLVAAEHLARVALLLGRASAAHAATSVILDRCELGAEGAKVIGEALGVSTTLKSIRYAARSACPCCARSACPCCQGPLTAWL